MECNKGEADRAREISVSKFTDNDFTGAKKFALKAQNMFPDLEGLPQFLATLKVYISAEKKINGVVDWYGVLDVDPLCDDETIKKNYRRLALTLHPDKNKSVGAEGAFKILFEAWSLLSDTSKKTLYDQKRNQRAIPSKIPTMNSSATAGNNGFHNHFTKCKNSSIKTRQNTHKKPDIPIPKSTPPVKSKTDMFYTVCPHCRKEHEYNIIFVNHKLLCPNCLEAFNAIDISFPRNGSNPNVGPSKVSGTDASRVNCRPRVYSKFTGGEDTPTDQASHAYKLPSGMLNKGREALMRKAQASKKSDGGGLANGSSSHVFPSSACRGENAFKKRRVGGKLN